MGRCTLLTIFSVNDYYTKGVLMKSKHMCPKCDQAVGWHGPPFEGRWAKLKAIAFHLKRRTLFSKDSKKYPFLKCLSCGYVVTFEEWTNSKMENEHIVERLEREEFHRKHVEPHLRPVKAVNQDVSRFMKHGHQAPWYRKSVKAKIQPDEEEDYFDEQENPAD